MPHGDVKSRRVRSSGGRAYRSRGRSYRSSSRSSSTPVTPMGAEERAALDLKYEQMRLQRQQDEVDEIALLQANSVRLTGYLHSEVAQAIAVREKDSLPDGDWLDDPVEAYRYKPGFAEEYTVRQGIRLHVNLCLDCSNSTIHNKCDDAMRAATYTLYAMIDNVSKSLPEGTIEVSVWEWAKYKEGDGVRQTHPSYTDNKMLTEQQRMIDAIKDIYANGEDTYIAPLFAQLHRWEQEHGWAGEARLDIILTDGVLEHKKDRKSASEWQLKRNGGLQTIMLNFLPMNEWADVQLPDHCFQYEATVDNVFTLMTKVFGEWILTI